MPEVVPVDGLVPAGVGGEHGETTGEFPAVAGESFHRAMAVGLTVDFLGESQALIGDAPPTAIALQMGDTGQDRRTGREILLPLCDFKGSVEPLHRQCLAVLAIGNHSGVELSSGGLDGVGVSGTQQPFRSHRFAAGQVESTSGEEKYGERLAGIGIQLGANRLLLKAVSCSELALASEECCEVVAGQCPGFPVSEPLGHLPGIQQMSPSRDLALCATGV